MIYTYKILVGKSEGERQPRNPEEYVEISIKTVLKRKRKGQYV
jgi:hypothetical protein